MDIDKAKNGAVLVASYILESLLTITSVMLVRTLLSANAVIGQQLT